MEDPSRPSRNRFLISFLRDLVRLGQFVSADHKVLN